MKKWIFLLIFLIIPINVKAFTTVLSDAIKNDKRLFFAYVAGFEEGEYLLTAALTDDGVVISAFSEADGAEVTDRLTVINDGVVSVVSDGRHEYISHSAGNKNTVYTLEEDSFRMCNIEKTKTVIKIATIEEGRVDTHKNTVGAAYNLLNNMKLEMISSYSFIDRRNSMDEADLMRLRIALVSAADIMSFDVKNCDADRLMKYVLNTHHNFLGAVPFSPDISAESDGVNIVSAGYIDHIVTEIFNQKPLRPPINELAERGYCYNGSNYHYTDAFNVPFSTEFDEIEAVFDVGNGVYYVIFGDIYTENGTSIPEYSYMILKEKDNGYSILRLEMGGELLSEREVLEYARVDKPKKYMWENTDTQKGEKEYICVWYVLAAFLVLAAVICVLYRKMRNKK